MKVKQIPTRLDPEFIGVNIKGLLDNDLTLIMSSGPLLDLFAGLIEEIQISEIRQLSTAPLSPSTLDITEKIELVKRKQLSRFKFTLKNLKKVAEEEILRRKKLKASKTIVVETPEM